MQLADLSSEDFGAFVQWLYTQRVEVDTNLDSNLIPLAHMSLKREHVPGKPTDRHFFEEAREYYVCGVVKLEANADLGTSDGSN